MQYIENENSLSNEQKDIIRALKSIQEEVEATDFYYQRWCVATSKEAKDIMFHNMLEEIEHTNMLMGFLNNVLPENVKYEPKSNEKEVKQEIKDLVKELTENEENSEKEEQTENAVESSEQILGGLIKTLEAEEVVEDTNDIDNIDMGNNDNSIVESTVSRVMNHFEGANGFFTISACRNENTDEENILKTQELKEDLRSYKLGYIRQVGGFIEINKATGKEKPVEEKSFFVIYNGNPDKYFNIVYELAQKYQQYSFIFKNSETKEIAEYRTADLGIENEFSKFGIDEFAKYFSRIISGTKNQQKIKFIFK